MIFKVESYCCNDKENCNEENFDDDLNAMTQNFNAWNFYNGLRYPCKILNFFYYYVLVKSI